MKLTLTNYGPEGVPFIVGDQVEALEPGSAFSYDGAETVAIIGDKPSVREQLKQGLQTIAATARKLIEAILSRHQVNPLAASSSAVSVTIQNEGANAVRVILGDGVSDFNVAPGTTYDATAAGYLELRELGLIEQPHNAGTPD